MEEVTTSGGWTGWALCRPACHRTSAEHRAGEREEVLGAKVGGGRLRDLAFPPGGPLLPARSRPDRPRHATPSTTTRQAASERSTTSFKHGDHGARILKTSRRHGTALHCVSYVPGRRIRPPLVNCTVTLSAHATSTLWPTTQAENNR